MTDTDLMSEEISDLLYKHFDSDGELIDDFEDVLYCEDEEIDYSKVSGLIKLLRPIYKADDALIPLEAAKLLSAWGIDEGLDFLEVCVDRRIDKIANLSPHRLHGYDVTYEEFEEAIANYYVRKADRSLKDADEASRKIESITKKILILSEELTFDISILIELISRKNWQNYKDLIREVLGKIDKNSYNYDIIDKLLKSWKN